MQSVRFTKAALIVRSGDIHPHSFQPGDVSDDAAVAEVAVRNGWAERVPLPSRPDVAAAGHASAAAAAAPANKAAPENK